MKSKQATRCPLCKSEQLQDVVEIKDIPVSINSLCDTNEKAIHVPKSDINLVHCQSCDFIYNTSFNKDVLNYNEAYENSLFFSKKFQSFADEISANLISKYSLTNKTILEIGCGKGDFLNLICTNSKSRGIGFDMSYSPESNHNISNEQVTFIRDFYSEKYSNYQPDMIICRHVLEHIDDPKQFLTTIKNANQSKNVVVYFEVPHASFMFQDYSVWDIIYEHYAYYNKNALATLFHSCGFTIQKVYPSFENQFLSIEAIIDNDNRDNLASNADFLKPDDSLKEYIPDFILHFYDLIDYWDGKIEKFHQDQKVVVIWGAGSKGISFLNFIGNSQYIQYVTDINPRKQNYYIAGTGHKIISPNELIQIKPDIIIAMNPNYINEIKAMLTDLNIRAAVISFS